MKIDIQFVNMPVSDFMQAYVIEKLNKLGKKYDLIISAAVFFKMENDPKGKGKICDIELSLYGPRLFASSNEENYKLAAKETISDLEKQLQKRAKKIRPYT